MNSTRWAWYMLAIILFIAMLVILGSLAWTAPPQ